MYRLPHIIFVLTILFAFLTGVAVAAGRVSEQSVLPEALLLFTHPDGTRCERPCLFGIQPGQMTLAEAESLLKKHPISEYIERTFYSGGLSVIASQTMTISLNDSNVGLIITLNLAPAVPLQDVLIMLGSPQSVYREKNLLWLIYDDTRMVFEIALLRGSRIERTAPVASIRLAEVQFILSGDHGPWRGFTTLKRYAK